MTSEPIFGQQAISLTQILQFLGTNTWMLHVYAIALLAGFTWLVNRFLRVGRRRAGGPGIGSIVIGADRRVSTSKVQVVLWSYAIAFALLSLVFHRALPADLNLDGTYLLLLGSPAAAALLAKGITSAKVRNGAIAKPPAKEEPSSLGTGVAQVVSDDEGRVEVFDLQYFLFTLVALTFFLVGFLSQDFGSATGLPDLPVELVALTGVSAAAYVAKKGVENQEPVLTGAYPETAFPGEKVRIRGKNLAFEIPDAEPLKPDIVLLRGRPTDVLAYSSGSVEARVPEGLEAGVASVKVMRSDGVFTADELELQIVTQQPKITSVGPDRIVIGEDDYVIARGTGFGIAGRDGTPASAGMQLDGRELAVASNGWGPTSVRAKLPTADEAQEQGYKLPGTAELVVFDARGRPSAAVSVHLELKKQLENKAMQPSGAVSSDGNGLVNTQGERPQPRPLPQAP